MIIRTLLAASLVASSLLACGGGASTPTPAADAATNPADVAVKTGDESEQIPPVGSGGADNIGRCAIADSTAQVSGSRTCIDYDDGFTAETATANCTAAGGTFTASESCSTSATSYVASCTVTADSTTRRHRFYLRNRSEGLTPASIETWCNAQSGTYDGPSAPRNTGRCRAAMFDGIEGNDNTRACTDYEQGFSVNDATMGCGSNTFEVGEQCTVSGRLGGCRIATEGRTAAIYLYARTRGGAIASNAQIQAFCESNGGTYLPQ